MENETTLTAPAKGPSRFVPAHFPSPGYRPAPPRLRTFNTRGLYSEALIELRSYIENEYTTVKRFCDVHNIDRFNLSKCFRAEANATGKEMSVGLYLRCMVALNMIDPCELGDVSHEDADAINTLFPMSLREYLLVNNNAVMKSLLMLIQPPNGR